MNRFQWKWIFTGSMTCCAIWRPFWFAMMAILNQEWPYKNPAIWAKFGFQHDRVKNWALIISCYVLTLFFIHTTSTCIVHLGDICNALRYSNQYFNYLFTFEPGMNEWTCRFNSYNKTSRIYIYIYKHFRFFLGFWSSSVAS